MQIHAREILFSHPLFSLSFLREPSQWDQRIQASIPLFCPFIILSSLPTSKLKDKIMGGQNDLRLTTNRSCTPESLRKSQVSKGRIRGEKNSFIRLGVVANSPQPTQLLCYHSNVSL